MGRFRLRPMVCMRMAGQSASKEYGSALIDMQEIDGALDRIEDTSAELVPAMFTRLQ